MRIQHTWKISIHKALTGLDLNVLDWLTGWYISIHKALTGLDVTAIKSIAKDANFNPQGPHGPRRKEAEREFEDILISIHKALTGLDRYNSHAITLIVYFNPQGPHGPRLQTGKSYRHTPIFQSTRPSRASTKMPQLSMPNMLISIHKALTGLDNGYGCLERGSS